MLHEGVASMETDEGTPLGGEAPMVDEIEEVEDVELLDEEPADNARDLTSGLVITTFVVLLLALVVMEMALAKWFEIGPFK